MFSILLDGTKSNSSRVLPGPRRALMSIIISNTASFWSFALSHLLTSPSVARRLAGSSWLWKSARVWHSRQPSGSWNSREEGQPLRKKKSFKKVFLCVACLFCAHAGRVLFDVAAVSSCCFCHFHDKVCVKCHDFGLDEDFFCFL